MTIQLKSICLIAAAAILLTMAGKAHAQEYICRVAEKHSCEAGTGCKAIQTSVWNLIDTNRSQFARCDRQGCDSYQARITASGIFFNIEIPGRAMLAKMSNDGTTFVEVVSLGMVVLTSFGSCSRK